MIIASRESAAKAEDCQIVLDYEIPTVNDRHRASRVYTGRRDGSGKISQTQSAGIATRVPVSNAYSLRKVTVVPSNAPVEGVHYMFRLPQAVAFSGITQHHSFDADIT